jgi:hypothetical protein
VFQENCNYGFRRNLWGMRPAGLPLSTACTLACDAILFYKICSAQSWVIPAVTTMVCAILAFLWIFRFSADWVRTAADAYAQRLLEACDSLNH